MKAISAEEMSKLDFLAVEKFGITLLQMMELAGLNLAEFNLSISPIKKSTVDYSSR